MSTTRIHPIPFLIALVPSLAGCALVDPGTVYGSGTRAEEARSVSDFQAVVLSVSGRTEVRVGEERSLRISCDDDLLSYVTTEVRGGVLRIDMPEGYEFRERLRVVITTPELTRFEVHGSADARIENVRGEHLAVTIEGSGDVEVDGKVKLLRATIEGSGDLRLTGLRSERADVSIQGNGAVALRVAYVLRYQIDGSGDIRYLGNPSVSGGINGSGSVRRDQGS